MLNKMKIKDKSKNYILKSEKIVAPSCHKTYDKAYKKP